MENTSLTVATPVGSHLPLLGLCVERMIEIVLTAPEGRVGKCGGNDRCSVLLPSLGQRLFFAASIFSVRNSPYLHSSNSDTMCRRQFVLINGHLLSLMCAPATNSSFRNHVLAYCNRRKSYLDANLIQRDLYAIQKKILYSLAIRFGCKRDPKAVMKRGGKGGSCERFTAIKNDK